MNIIYDSLPEQITLKDLDSAICFIISDINVVDSFHYMKTWRISQSDVNCVCLETGVLHKISDNTPVKIVDITGVAK